MLDVDKYGPMRDKLQMQIVGSKATVSKGMSSYDMFCISVRVPYIYGVDLEYDVMVDASSSSPDIGFKPICADMGTEGARQTLWQWYNWCKIDEIESLKVWDSEDDTSLVRLSLELLHKFREYNLKIIQSWDRAKVAVNALQSVLNSNFEGMGCFAKPRNETDFEKAIISFPINAVTQREETFESEALFCVVAQDAEVVVAFPLETMCCSGIKICIVEGQPLMVVKEFNHPTSAWESNQSILSYLTVLLHSITRPIVARRQLLRALQSHIQSVLEYDPRGFRSIHFLLRLRLKNPPTHVMCIVRVELPEHYPQDGPSVSLLEPLGSGIGTLGSNWFSSEWDADQVAQELLHNVSRILTDRVRV